MSITITRALNELKLLDKRIKKEISEAKFVTVIQGNKSFTFDKTTKEEFANNAKSMVQSIQDLIVRKNQIKAAILESNGMTKVTIAGNEYTVAEAIYKKESIELDKFLLETMKSQISKITNTVEKHNTKVEENLQQQLLAAAGSDKDKIKSMQEYADVYKSTNEANLYDPANIAKLIVSFENDIDTFESEVDFVLSESNSTTFIEV